VDGPLIATALAGVPVAPDGKIEFHLEAHCGVMAFALESIQMRLLTSWSIAHSGGERTIELLQGDLSCLPAEHAVDILVVSAFAGDYLPTPSSLIGGLDRTGISVAALAKRKAVDMREQFSCWLSQPIEKQFSFRRLLCIESGWRGSPPEITDDLFRALAPYLLTDCPNASVAMPIIGAGDQGWPAGDMIESILRAAVSWIQRGLPLRLLKIVAYSQATSDLAYSRFVSIRETHEVSDDRGSDGKGGGKRETRSSYDVFLSYCHEDESTANLVKTKVELLQPGVRIFFDRTALKTGASWLMQIAESLDSAHRVVALYTPHYWSSPSCKDEFAAALARQNDTGEPILFPMYVLSAKIPYLFRNLQYLDCREGDTAKLAQACSALAQML
jgi:hypothetical protein